MGAKQWWKSQLTLFELNHGEKFKTEEESKEGEDDVLEEDDVFPDPVQEPHVEEQVDPGKGEGDGTDLPVQAGVVGPKEVVGSHVESEAVNKSIAEENSW